MASSQMGSSKFTCQTGSAIDKCNKSNKETKKEGGMKGEWKGRAQRWTGAVVEVWLFWYEREEERERERERERGCGPILPPNSNNDDHSQSSRSRKSSFCQLWLMNSQRTFKSIK
jgi:hypothetical protein